MVPAKLLPTLTAVFFFVATLIAAPASTQSLELPAETWLDPVAISVELSGATIEVFRETTSKPALRARVPGETEEQPVLSIVRGTSLVEIRRADDGTAPLALELLIGVQQPLRIVGAELQILAVGSDDAFALEDAAQGGVPEGDFADEDEDGDDEDEEDEEDEDEDGDEEDDEDQNGGEIVATPATAGRPAPAGERPLFELDIERSEVQLVGIPGAVVTAAGSHLIADGTSEVLSLQFFGGGTEITSHVGKVDLRSIGTASWVEDQQGDIEFAIEEGSLRFRGGTGSARGTAIGGLVELDGWHGPLSLESSDATLEFRSTRERQSSLSLTGQNLDATISGLFGQLSANLRGSRLQLAEKGGNTNIQAFDGAEIDIEVSYGNTDLKLENSSARLVDLRGPRLKIELHDGRVEAENIRHLELTAERGEVIANGLSELGRTQIVDTRLELDLTSLRRPPMLAINGASEAWVRLATPCAVELSQAQMLSDRIDVTGCELHSPGTRRGRHGDRGLGGNSRLTLKATVAEDSHLEVEGYP